jgi:hypothetical protein
MAKVLQGSWRTLTFLAALRRDRIDAPRVIDGPITGQRFLACVEQLLVSTLELATLSSSTTSAATRATLCAAPFAPPAQSRSTCRPTVPISIRLSTLQNPRRCCARPPSAPSKLDGSVSVPCCNRSPLRSAPTTLEMQDMLQRKWITPIVLRESPTSARRYIRRELGRMD